MSFNLDRHDGASSCTTIVGRLGALCSIDGRDPTSAACSVLVVEVEVEGAKAESLLASSSERKGRLLKAGGRGPGDVLGLRTLLSQERDVAGPEFALVVELEVAGEVESVGIGWLVCALFTPPLASKVESASYFMALTSIKDLAEDETPAIEEMKVAEEAHEPTTPKSALSQCYICGPGAIELSRFSPLPLLTKVV